ncbi:type II toxin-antitoxin system RelE/ParE family toxin [Levilactobacillus acidifarinae]|uniref:Uncharacterized protein n=1 Tax=Levilactobacillus acidifarinae DSM 19394 = JCM 15949 TaxID=1423715 RepID=A0A0R1LTM4_9LACO|nr:type II toxin-antitoxin system mRNA interferase toxin, RelE/StbE family [Levilactobacillus acidifarinae]KRK95706.1 hypothetical protein FD25_GL000121 [Levilactobacillus acidifarinae DSM 19394]GEO69442.1 hypothetical protein LAC03_13520 [Levilactobacillus acidifarinae]
MGSQEKAWRIITTARYDRQLAKLARKHYSITKIGEAIDHIIADDHDILITQYHLHYLTGDKKGISEIHLEDDWLLEYKIKHNVLLLTLLETGSHQQLLGK